MIILLYHNVVEHRPSAFNMLARPDWLSVDEFEEEISSLSERFDLVSVDDIANAIRERRRIPRGCAITFDDGYTGAARHGLPVLEKFGAVGAMYVVTGRVADARCHDVFDELEALLLFSPAAYLELSAVGLGTLPLTCDACKLAALKAIGRLVKKSRPDVLERLLAIVRRQSGSSESAVSEYLKHDAFRSVTWDQLRDARSRGHVVGSHGRTHRTLSAMARDELAEEVTGSFKEVAANVATERVALAYPFGLVEHFDANVIAATERAGFCYGLTAMPGANDEHTGIFELRRVTFRDLRKVRVQ